MGRKLKDASVAVGDSAGTGTNSAPAGYNSGATSDRAAPAPMGTTSGRKLQDAVVGTGNGGSAVSVRIRLGFCTYLASFFRVVCTADP